MKRLTDYFGSRPFALNDDIPAVIKKLAAYEDTGLTPSKITALKSENERLRGQLERAKEDTGA